MVTHMQTSSHTGWVVGVARKTDGRIDAEEYGVAIADMGLALNAVRRLVGRAPETHVWVKEPMLGEGEALEPGAVHRRDAEMAGAKGFALRRASR
jgi:hypothetical protein